MITVKFAATSMGSAKRILECARAMADRVTVSAVAGVSNRLQEAIDKCTPGAHADPSWRPCAKRTKTYARGSTVSLARSPMTRWRPTAAPQDARAVSRASSSRPWLARRLAQQCTSSQLQWLVDTKPTMFRQLRIKVAKILDQDNTRSTTRVEGSFKRSLH